MKFRDAFTTRLYSALKPAGIHLLASLFLATLTALLIFKIWFPWPIHEMIPGQGLFWLIVTADVICGPLLTLVIWNTQKPRSELLLDVTLIFSIQIFALSYGLYTTASTRPVHIVFETDRLRVVTASEIDPRDLAAAPEALRNLPWSGPTLLSLRKAKNGDELIESVDLSLAGKEPSIRPDWWQPYEAGIPAVLQRARPLGDILKSRPDKIEILNQAIKKSGSSENDLLWLPFTSARSMEWIALIDKKTGLPKTYAPIDGFF